MANIKDIAKAAGVGVSTVSRVLNDQPDVKASTKEKVLKVIEALNYVPNSSARNLKRIKSNHIGVYVIGEYSSFFSTVIETIEKEISKHGYSIILHFNHNQEKHLESAVQFTLEKRLVGLIYLGGEVSKLDEGYLKQFTIPFVFASTMIDRDIDHSLYNSVNINNMDASYKAVAHLLNLKHRDIALISAGDDHKSVSKARHDAYIKALDERSITYKTDYIAWGNYSMQSGYDAMKTLLDKKLPITAVFAVADLMAIGALKAICDQGLKVPEDISIIGFDGLEITKFIHPTLATIQQPAKEMGHKIIEVLVKALEDKSSVVEHIVLETQLIEGHSCKCL